MVTEGMADAAVLHRRPGGRWQPIVRVKPRVLQENLWALFFLAPYLIGLVVFTAGPILASLGLSFSKWDLITPPRVVGLANYARLFDDKYWWKAVANTFYFSVLNLIGFFVLCPALAMLVNQKLRAMTAFRALYYLPAIASGTALAYVWGMLFSYPYGVINYALVRLGLEPVNWLGDAAWAMPALALIVTWRGLGNGMVVYLAALQGIPNDYYEAAQIDGANGWQRFRHITIPIVSPTTFFLLVTGVIGCTSIFEPMYVLTHGGPRNATISMVFQIFTYAFRRLAVGYASAMAWFLFAIVLTLTLIQWASQKRWVHYDM